MMNYEPYTSEDIIINDIKKKIEGSKLLQEIPFGNRLFGIMIPVWPKRSNGSEIEYVKTGGMYNINLKKTNVTVVYGQDITTHNLPSARIRKTAFVFEDFDDIPFRYYVVSSGIEGISSGDIVSLRSDIMMDSLSSYFVDGIQVVPINKEFILTLKKK